MDTRPKEGAVSTAPALNRLAVATPRTDEYFSENGLSMRMGGPRADWPFILVKELIDNGLDASEANSPPVITVTIEPDKLTVTDNGPGLPETVINGSLDFNGSISTKTNYVSPTRGRLGNALKVVYAAPYVTNGKQGRITIDTAAARSLISVTYDPIARLPRLERTIAAPTVKNGTSIAVEWSDVASLLTAEKIADFYRLIESYAVFNPHATFELRAGEHYTLIAARAPEWTKWHVTRPTPAHWYSGYQLETLISATLRTAPDQTMRQFVAQFAGLSGTGKQKAITLAAGVSKVSDLATETDFNHAALARLHAAMLEASKPIKPEVLGVIGKDALRTWIEQQGPVSEFAYKKDTGLLVCADEIARWPYVVEVAFAVMQRGPRRVFVGINWAVPIKENAIYLDPAFNAAMIETSDPVCVVVSVALVEAKFSDHGKARLELPPALSNIIQDFILATAKSWTKMKAKMEREQLATYRHWVERQKQLSRPKLSAKAACSVQGVMCAAYMLASDNGRLPANARQIMYAIRPVIIELTGKERPWKHDDTFTQVILPNYLMSHPEETANWDVVFDDRGHFEEPHTGKRIGLGTVSVREYVATWGAPRADRAVTASIDSKIQTNGPIGRFRFALFIEKEGFQSLLERAQFAQRYDIAIFSTKGMSNTASRFLAEKMAEQGVTILTLHDFDRAGLKIFHTLSNDTRRYQFKTRPRVIDLGLRLTDVEALELPPEPVTYTSDRDPRLGVLESGGTQAEADFLVREGCAKNWSGARVELNALTSAQFVAWLDSKLVEVGVSKIVPDQSTLITAFERVCRAALVEERTRDIVTAVNQEHIDSPPDLVALVNEHLKSNPALSWDEAVRHFAATNSEEVANA